MRLYQFHFFDTSGARRTLDLVEAPDDGSASEQAFLDLRGHLSCKGVEVFDGDRLVAHLERPSDTFLMSRAGVHGLG
jgi:hypothetical protein